MEDRPAHDNRLVEAVLRGDDEAFRTLVERYQRMVAGVIWRSGFPPDDVEDLVSEVFLKVYRNLRQYRPEHAFSTWLYRLTANHAVDHARKRRKERGRSEMPVDVVDTSPSPAARAETGERARLLREALAGLDPRYREAIVLVYVEGKKVSEAARTLGLPEGTIKTRLMRGREALRKILATRYPSQFGD